jgi:hypothetical protein
MAAGADSGALAFDRRLGFPPPIGLKKTSKTHEKIPGAKKLRLRAFVSGRIGKGICGVDAIRDDGLPSSPGCAPATRKRLRAMERSNEASISARLHDWSLQPVIGGPLLLSYRGSVCRVERPSIRRPCWRRSLPIRFHS